MTRWDAYWIPPEVSSARAVMMYDSSSRPLRLTEPGFLAPLRNAGNPHILSRTPPSRSETVGGNLGMGVSASGGVEKHPGGGITSLMTILNGEPGGSKDDKLADPLRVVDVIGCPWIGLVGGA